LRERGGASILLIQQNFEKPRPQPRGPQRPGAPTPTAVPSARAPRGRHPPPLLAYAAAWYPPYSALPVPPSRRLVGAAWRTFLGVRAIVDSDKFAEKQFGITKSDKAHKALALRSGVFNLQTALLQVAAYSADLKKARGSPPHRGSLHVSSCPVCPVCRSGTALFRSTSLTPRPPPRRRPSATCTPPRPSTTSPPPASRSTTRPRMVPLPPHGCPPSAHPASLTSPHLHQSADIPPPSLLPARRPAVQGCAAAHPGDPGPGPLLRRRRHQGELGALKGCWS